MKLKNSQPKPNLEENYTGYLSLEKKISVLKNKKNCMLMTVRINIGFQKETDYHHKWTAPFPCLQIDIKKLIFHMFGDVLSA